MNIKELRKKQGMTQVDVAIKVGVSVNAYQLWERGAMKPNPENKKKLEQVLGRE